ncbi:hypothetical protein BJX65DRAFT_269842 [Aspergillus insuetus]
MQWFGGRIWSGKEGKTHMVGLLTLTCMSLGEVLLPQPKRRIDERHGRPGCQISPTLNTQKLEKYAMFVLVRFTNVGMTPCRLDWRCQQHPS